ncbi:MAG TPA: CPBP family intramembrane metalloprotease, partial [Candidatus Acetothermia bacterium]|nr:CPBP family intramembrane metalloprotease [Candidatus Acetothermia bacterium]
MWPIVRALALQALDWSGWAAFLPTLAVLAVTSHTFGWPSLSPDHAHLLITPEVRVWLMVIAQLTGLSMFVLSWRLIEHKTLPDMLLDHSRDLLRPLMLGLSSGAGAISLVALGIMASGSLRLTWGSPAISGHATLAGVGFLIATSFLGPLTEEIESRGYLFQNVFRGWGTAVATIVTALVFAARHLQNPNVSALGIINIALISIGLTLGMLHLRSLWYTIGWHIAWNFSLLFIFGFANSGYSLETFSLSGMSLFSSTLSGRAWLTGG